MGKVKSGTLSQLPIHLGDNPDYYVEIAWCEPAKRGGKLNINRAMRGHSLQDGYHKALELSGNGFEVYFGINPRSNGEQERAGDEDIAAVTAIYAEDPEGQLDAIRGFALPPTKIWETSPGKYQAIWWLREALTPEEGRALQQKFSAVLRTDAKDISRVLRIPGTHSYKHNCEIRLIEDQTYLYRAEELSRALDGMAGGKRRGSPSGKPETPGQGPIFQGTRNVHLTRIAGGMRRQGMSYTEIKPSLQKVNRERCKPPISEEELDTIARGIERYPPAPGFEREHLTDLGNARRLVARYGENLHYCRLWRTWLIWTGTQWLRDDIGEVERLAKDTVRGIYKEAARVEDEEERKRLARWAFRSEAAQKLRAMITLAETEPSIPVMPDDLDSDPWQLNCKNGTLDLKAGELRPHRAVDLITKEAPVEYDPDARSPLWDKFLDRIMAGNTAMIEFLQRAVGYALTGSTREQVLFILWGSGSNGKTTFLEAIRQTLGDYAQQTPASALLVRRFEGIPNDLARLKASRFVTAIEAEEGRRLAESLVKQMTGGDKIAARFMRAEWFEFTPSFKIFLGTNHKPVIRGTDLAIWRRIRLIPFTVTIPEDEQDKDLLSKLLEEKSGILRWAVQGCQEWQRNGLGLPEEVKDATQSYQAESDVLAQFLAECTVEAPTVSVRAGQLYKAYRDWCEENGEKPVTGTAFGRKMAERGYEKARERYVTYIGIGLRVEEYDE